MYLAMSPQELQELLSPTPVSDFEAGFLPDEDPCTPFRRIVMRFHAQAAKWELSTNWQRHSWWQLWKEQQIGWILYQQEGFEEEILYRHTLILTTSGELLFHTAVPEYEAYHPFEPAHALTIKVADFQASISDRFIRQLVV